MKTILHVGMYVTMWYYMPLYVSYLDRLCQLFRSLLASAMYDVDGLGNLTLSLTCHTQNGAQGSNSEGVAVHEACGDL